jgi:hypothetical protein
MTRKHFELIAKTFNARLVEKLHRPINEFVTVETIARDLAKIFEQANPNFDAKRFLDACGVDKPEYQR